MSQRFFVLSPILGPRVSLTDAEAHHVTQVMRGKVGDAVLLFDGSGAEFTARIARLSRHAVELEVLSRQEVNRELPRELTLGVALPKGDRQRWLIEKAVELGVSRVVPLQTARGVAQPLEHVLERLRRAVVEASKQCGRNRLLEIAAPQTLGEFLGTAPHDAWRLLADPDPSAVPAGDLRAPDTCHAILVAIGPEGGFTDQELQAAVGWQRVSLGPRVLRIETAAIAVAAWLALGTASASVGRNGST
jgi:16S rRNA (uracil1498-N3)-methyltransferase